MGEYVTPKGELVLTAPVVFGRSHVVPVIAAFSQHTWISTCGGSVRSQVQILDDHLELAVRIGALPDSSMIAVQVVSDRLRP